MIRRLFNTRDTSSAIVYAVRCVLGFMIGYFLYMTYRHEELFWTILSIVLVISPEEKDSKKLSLDRFKSNLIGSTVGVICYLIHPPNAYMMVIGIVTTILICYLLDIISMARVAIVAVLIILSYHTTNLLEYAPIIRFLTVALGCFIGLFVVVSTSWMIKKLKINL